MVQYRRQRIFHAWMFVLNNPNKWIDQKEETDMPKLLLDKSGQDVLYMTYGHEVGFNGTYHLQGYVFFKDKISFNEVRRIFPKYHIEQAIKGPTPCRIYCQKSGVFSEYGDHHAAETVFFKDVFDAPPMARQLKDEAVSSGRDPYLDM